MSSARLVDVAVALLARRAGALPDGLERRWLEALEGVEPRASLDAAQNDPWAPDAALIGLRRQLGLSEAELLAVALAAEVESDAELGRIVARLQQPLGGSRPSLGLLASLLQPVSPGLGVLDLALGPAVASGLLELTPAGAPLAERAVAVPLHLIAALRGQPGVHEACDFDVPEIALPESTLEAAARHALALAAHSKRALVIRCGNAAEGRCAAAAIARALNATPLFLSAGLLPGLVPWLHVAGLVPVFLRSPSPGETARLPALPGYTGPLLAVAGPDGAVETPNGSALAWRLPIPPQDERRRLWGAELGDPELAQSLAELHRHGAGRIAELARLARHHAETLGRAQPTRDDVCAVAWLGEGSTLSALAQPLSVRVSDAAVVLPPPLRAGLELLERRCRVREGLSADLGVAARQRYTPGVRALFVGPSGTGKTLLALWLATRLNMPLYRVDVSAVTSKYIGETERNLAELLARAEHAEVVLLFDEADTLFGKRTDVRHSTDRFANSQTNYLLERIESYEGIALLTSNTRARFDEAFARRLDVVLEVPAPGPEERRALWHAHLGTSHTLDARALNRLSAAVDLVGGHVKNVVLAAAVLASSERRPIGWDDLLRGLELEYRKLGRPLPAVLGSGDGARVARPAAPIPATEAES